MKYRELAHKQVGGDKIDFKRVGTGIMFTYKMNVDVQEWDLFLQNHP